MLIAVIAVVALFGASLIGLRRRKQRLGSGIASPVIDSFTLSEPWRRHVATAQSQQRRYNEIVAATPAGPLADRLTELKRQVQHSIDECWQIAKRGDELDAVITKIDPARLRSQMQTAGTDATRTSLESQLASAARISQTRDDTDAKLRLLNTRMGELVTQAAEVSVSSDGTEALGTAIDDVVTQLEALREAVVDVNNPATNDQGRTATS